MIAHLTLNVHHLENYAREFGLFNATKAFSGYKGFV